MKQLTNEQMIDVIRKCLLTATQKELAGRLGVSPQFLGDVLKGRREVTERVAGRFGYTRRTVFERGRP